MALSKEKKQQVVGDIGQLLTDSKLTVIAAYPGTTVKAMQEMRRIGNETGTVVRVAKNRLVKRALLGVDSLKNADTSALSGQLLYAFNSQDEVAPAQLLNKAAKSGLAPLEFVGAITAEGQFLGPDDVKALASLPSKEQLRGQLVGMLSAPLSGFVNVLSGNLRGVLNVLTARAENL